MEERKGFGLILSYLFIVTCIVIWCVLSMCKRCSGTIETRDSVHTEKHDTIFIEVHDTLPAEKGETILRYVKIPMETQHEKDTCQEIENSLTLPVVQKTFSDDSTYTAYVSGVKYDNLPKLDSIAVRMREITHTIHETITVTKEKKHSHFGIGAQAGYGYGLSSGRFEPYIGLGVSFNF